MSQKPPPQFSGGRNIAMKVPPHVWEETVTFYRDILGLRQIDTHLPEVVFAFGANQLWIDKVDGLSQAELWLEITTDGCCSCRRSFQGGADCASRRN